MFVTLSDGHMINKSFHQQREKMFADLLRQAGIEYVLPVQRTTNNFDHVYLIDNSEMKSYEGFGKTNMEVKFMQVGKFRYAGIRGMSLKHN